MLQNLHVKNLALIDEAEVDFSSGLNILTGETGAGKSIVLGSVSLALGGRYSADMLRKGADYGLVELTFGALSERTLEKLKAMDIFPEDGQVMISRRLMEGRSVSRINGETVTISRLKEAAAELIDIHGQHEHQSLLFKKNHLSILDAFSKKASQIKQEVKNAFKEYKENQKELGDADTDESERMKEAAFLEFEISEIRDAGVTPEEAQETEDTYRRMISGKRISENLEEAYAYISGEGEGNASDAVGRAVRAMAEAADHDSRAEELYGQLLDIESLLGDFSRELRDYMDSLSFSPEAFYEVESRLNEINHLKSKYGNTVEEILEYCEEKEERLQILKDYDTYLEQLRAKTGESETKLRGLCETLSQLRKKEAKQLEKQIKKGLQDLNFLDVQFEIQFKETRGYTENGTDDVEFMISMNPGEAPRPLSEVASGGELSRIMLAIKSVMADKDEIETLIFDEIDVGISGRTAQKVSEKMGLIGKKHQVICITHLAQIAAMADAHYAIEKKVEKNVTKTTIFHLDEEEEIREIARILGGAKITDTVLENAKEMKILAAGLKR
ncbi:MAG: DNA repair protein RecN [Coprococcus sp.]|nr:DNA repair protein RecN [Coprococcus sp.]